MRRDEGARGVCGSPRSLKHIYNRAYVHTRFVRKLAAGGAGEGGGEGREALMTELSIDNMRSSRDWQRGGTGSSRGPSRSVSYRTCKIQKIDPLVLLRSRDQRVKAK